jgi:hypothetical protein
VVLCSIIVDAGDAVVSESDIVVVVSVGLGAVCADRYRSVVCRPVCSSKFLHRSGVETASELLHLTVKLYGTPDNAGAVSLTD